MGNPLITEETHKAHALLSQMPCFSETRMWMWVPPAHRLNSASGDSSMHSSSRIPNPQVPQRPSNVERHASPSSSAHSGAATAGTLLSSYVQAALPERPLLYTELPWASLKPASEGISARKPGAGVVSTMEADLPSPTSPWLPCFLPRALSSAHNLLFPTSHLSHCCQ